MQLIPGRAELEPMWFLIWLSATHTASWGPRKAWGRFGAVGGLPHWLQEAQFALSPGSHSFYPIPQALTKNRQWCRPRYTRLTDKTSPTAPGKTRLLLSLLFFLLIMCQSRRRALQRVCVSLPGAASCLTCWAGFRRHVWEETPPGDADTLCWSWKTSHTVQRF